MDIKNAEFTSVFSYATDQALSIVKLHLVDLVICVFIGLLVIGLVSAAVLKFRYRGDHKEPHQDPGNKKLEIMWTVIPALILTYLAILTAQVMLLVNPPVGSRQPDVIIIGHQWWWEYRYPKFAVTTANELYLPVGYNALFRVEGADVIHSFWVPDFGQKMDAIPGHPNFVFYKPIKKGLFLGQCAEFCGEQHSLMRIMVNVVSAHEFDTWIKKQQKIPTVRSDTVAQKGEKLFMSQTCSQCHSIAGSSAKGQIGPNLTHISTRSTLGSGIIANNTENLSAWIRNAQQFKPGSYMPKMRLSQSDAHDIAVFLESLK